MLRARARHLVVAAVVAVVAIGLVAGFVVFNWGASSKFEYRPTNASQYYYDQNTGDLTVFVFASGRYIERLASVKVVEYRAESVVVSAEIRKDLSFDDPTTGDVEFVWMKVHLENPLMGRSVVNVDGASLTETAIHPSPDERLTPANV